MPLPSYCLYIVPPSPLIHCFPSSSLSAVGCSFVSCTLCHFFGHFLVFVFFLLDHCPSLQPLWWSLHLLLPFFSSSHLRLVFSSLFLFTTELLPSRSSLPLPAILCAPPLMLVSCDLLSFLWLLLLRSTLLPGLLPHHLGLVIHTYTSLC